MWPLVLLVLAQAKPQTHLGQELSPYLLQHAADDVEWFPWGTEALARARREGKPLFVVVGESASHSCRAVDRELLSDAAVAQSLNERFVSIRVDRYERPDIDRSLKWLNGATDDPILAVMTPQGGPLADGTFDLHQHGCNPAAFRAWLTAVSASFRTLPAGAPTKTRPTTPTAALRAPSALELADEAVRKIVTGSGHSARPGDVRALPHGTLRLLLTGRARAQNPDAFRTATTLLDRLARGGIRDQVAGGFHHAAAGDSWTVAHFQKLLCDNALLLRAYAQAYAVAKDLLYRDVAREISTWAIRDMRDSSGLFWTSSSATTEGQEGRFYLWTRDELVGALGADRAAEFLQVYRLEPPGVLSLAGSPFAGLGPSREVLQARRARRVRPTVDDRVLTGWNGVMVGALATSGSLLKRGPDIEAARRGAVALRERLGPARGLRHFAVGRETRGSAFLQDYAYLAEGLLDLYDATGERPWRDDAGALVDAAVSRFWDVAQGGFRESDETHAPSLPSPKTALDGDLPAANGVMASVLLRFWRLTGERRYLELGRRTVDAFRAELEESPQATCTLAAAATLLPPAARTSR